MLQLDKLNYSTRLQICNLTFPEPIFFLQMTTSTFQINPKNVTCTFRWKSFHFDDQAFFNIQKSNLDSTNEKKNSILTFSEYVAKANFDSRLKFVLLLRNDSIWQQTIFCFYFPILAKVAFVFEMLHRKFSI